MQVLNIPAEITDQCRGGGSLLIGGGPGSGKTILTLSLLHKLKSLGLEVTFISTRLPIDTLFKTTPLCQDLGIESLVDSSLQRGHKDGPRVARVPMIDLSDLAMLLLQKCNEKSVVALDSWNALLQREKRSEEEVYGAAMDLINRTPGSLIFTTEDSTTLNPLQHVVDSHVRLEVGMVDGSRIRFLHVDKLRGRQIDTPSYVFTLADGRFNALDPRDWCLHERPIRAPKLPQPLRENGTYFSTGLTRLDKILGGGYKHGSHIGIEVDLEAPAEVFDLTFLPTAADFLVKQRPVIILPPGARDANSLWDTVRNIIDDKVWNHLKKELIDKYVRVLSFGSRTKDNSTVSIGSDIMNDLDIWRKTKKELKYRFGQPILGIIGYDTMSRMYGASCVEPIIGTTLPETRQLGDLMISIVTNDLEIKRHILGVSDYYFRLKLIKGIPVFWGVKPKTPPYALSLINDEGCPVTNLNRVS